MLSDGVLSALVACESRPQHTTARAHPARIYDALRARAPEVADFLTNADGKITQYL